MNPLEAFRELVIFRVYLQRVALLFYMDIQWGEQTAPVMPAGCVLTTDV